MIHMLFIVPYPELQEKVQHIFDHHSARETIQSRIVAEMAEHMDRLDYDCDVIVARGYTAQKLRCRSTEIPIIELPITSYDILRSLEECRTLYHPRRIAIIGCFNEPHDAALLSHLLQCDIRLYCPPSIGEIDNFVRKSLEDGCEVIIGGHSVRQCALHHGATAGVIETGDEAIITALNEVVRTADVITRKKEQAQMYETITQSSQEGILYVDRNHSIRIINKAALQMHQGARKFQAGCSLSTFYPFMCPRVEETLRTGKEVSAEVQHYGDTILSISYNPIVISSVAVGVVISFQDVTKIQHLEAQVRQKLSQRGLNAKYTFADIIHHSAALNRTIQIAQHYADVSSNVLITGETGTGKELFAQSIHNASRRREGPFVAINCAALNESLLESELFGYVEGAFTGASKGGKTGLFELAHHGTLFLDEISEIPSSLQGKLLRVLQEREVRRVGGTNVVSVDVRIIAATNRSLSQMVEEGTFRRDLLYRLDVLKLTIPPLRQRKEDIAALFHCFSAENNRKFGYQISGITPDALATLSSHDFFGNVRELENIVERISVLKTFGTVQKEDVMEVLFSDQPGPSAGPPAGAVQPMDLPSEREQILSTLSACGGNQSRAAALLHINRSTLWRKMKKYGLSPESSL